MLVKKGVLRNRYCFRRKFEQAGGFKPTSIGKEGVFEHSIVGKEGDSNKRFWSKSPVEHRRTIRTHVLEKMGIRTNTFVGKKEIRTKRGFEQTLV